MAPFPRNVEDFDSDPRIAFDKARNQHILEDENGKEWVWFSSVGKWTEAVDEEELEAQQANWAPAAPSATPASEPAPLPALDSSKKRKSDDEQEEEPEPKRAKPTESDAKQTKPELKQKNTALYLTGLPKDTTVDEVYEYCLQFGIIAETPQHKGAAQVTYDKYGDPVNHKIGPPRITLYKEKDGTVKGDALIVFHDAASVTKAVAVGKQFKFREDAKGKGIELTFEIADPSYKKTNSLDEEQRKQLRKDIAAAKFTTTVVVLSSMFTLDELKDNPDFASEIVEDTRKEIEGPLGEGVVKQIVVYDLEEDGVVAVTLDTKRNALKVIEMFRTAEFDGRKVNPHLWKKGSRFRKS